MYLTLKPDVSHRRFLSKMPSKAVYQPTDVELRRLFENTLHEFTAHVSSPTDGFSLLRADTPEMPRYLLTLAAIAAHAREAERDELRLCDIGGYYGIVAAAAATFGYETHLVDRYDWLESDHSQLRDWWTSKRLVVHDVDLQTANLRLPSADHEFNVVTLEAVIEHFPHTPRLVLKEIRRILRPDGLLLLDTPNAGALGTRVGFFLHGEGIWATIDELYASDIPFAGHSRCYSRREIVKVLRWSGFEVADLALVDLGLPRKRFQLLGRMRSRSSLGGWLLYDVVYPVIQRWFPGLRNCIWVAARPGLDRKSEGL